jgi:hypothetical protein
MKHKNRLLIALMITLLATAMTVSAAFAHNAGCIVLPDASYQSVGSLKEAPVVGAGNPNQLSNGQLDLIPGSGDQYGARFAADQGNSAVLPGECP